MGGFVSHVFALSILMILFMVGLVKTKSTHNQYISVIDVKKRLIIWFRERTENLHRTLPAIISTEFQGHTTLTLCVHTKAETCIHIFFLVRFIKLCVSAIVALDAYAQASFLHPQIAINGCRNTLKQSLSHKYLCSSTTHQTCQREIWQRKCIFTDCVSSAKFSNSTRAAVIRQGCGYLLRLYC